MDEPQAFDDWQCNQGGMWHWHPASVREHPTDVEVIGPDCFASGDEQVISWCGVNYHRHPRAHIISDTEDCWCEPHGGACPVITPPNEIWGAEELEALRKAMADPDYQRRLAADVAAERMVEVDNPFRREVRPRRGTDEGVSDE